MERGSSETSGTADQFPTRQEDHTALALQTMGLWVVAIADNIRNPVAGIGAALDVVRHQLDLKDQRIPTGKHHDPEILRYALEKIQNRLGSLNEYLTELVDFAKAPTLYKDSANLNHVIGELEPELKAQYPFPIQMTFQVDAKAMELVFVDRDRLKSSLKALLVNGIDSACALTSLTKTKDQVIPRVHLEANKSVEADRRERLVFVVEDNGLGFTPESYQRAFDAFFSTKEAGTGLGLYLVRKYIRAHGGDHFIATPPESGGARVGFWIPLVQSEIFPDHRQNNLADKSKKTTGAHL